MENNNYIEMKEIKVSCYNCNHSFIILCESGEDEECIALKKEYCEKCADDKYK